MHDVPNNGIYYLKLLIRLWHSTSNQGHTLRSSLMATSPKRQKRDNYPGPLWPSSPRYDRRWLDLMKIKQRKSHAEGEDPSVRITEITIHQRRPWVAMPHSFIASCGDLGGLGDRAVASNEPLYSACRCTRCAHRRLRLFLGSRAQDYLHFDEICSGLFSGFVVRFWVLPLFFFGADKINRPSSGSAVNELW